MLFGSLRMPRNLVFGAGQRRAAATFAVALGKRVLIVTDARLAGDAVLSELVEELSAADLAVRVYADILPELPSECLSKGVETGRDFGTDVVIGIGGGSCIDGAKVIALLLRHGGELADYYGEFKVPGPTVPLIAIPTTAGTGSEVTPVAVVSDPRRAVKVGIASPYLIPHTAICDPELTYSCPGSLTAVSGADALTHAIEAFTTRRRDITGSIVHEHVFLGKNELTDHNALLAIQNIGVSLRQATMAGSDHVARQKLMFGSMLAGLAFGTAGTSAAHAIQYPVGALTGTPHGAGVAVMLPYVMTFNRDHCVPEMAEIAGALGVGSPDRSPEANADAAIDAVARMFADIGIPSSLKELGLEAAKLDWTAEQAMLATRLVKNNPRALDIATMSHLVRAAFDGDRGRLMSRQADRKAS